YFADPAFMELLSFPYLIGDPSTALDEPYSIVITETLAKKYFNWDPQSDQSNDILNQTILRNKKQNLKITGVLKDIPANSHTEFDALISMETLIKSFWKDYNDHEGWSTAFLYFQLNPNTEISGLTKKIQDLLDKRYSETLKKLNASFTLQLQAVRDIHLHSTDFSLDAENRGDIQIVRFLMIICLFILAIAWTNYINLTTARSMKRAKEVGIKKIVGAGKKQLIEQFLLESILVNLIAILFAITMAQVLLPYFEQLVGKDLQTELLSRELLILISGFLILGVLVSGLYPALLLSSFKSISMLSGIKNRLSNRASLRKALVVVQYMITFSLILGTFAVYMQLSHMRNSKLGFNMEQMLIVRAPALGTSSMKTAKFNVFKNKLSPQKGIGSVTASFNIPGGPQMELRSFTREINNEEESIFFPVNSVDPDFFETYGIKMKYGRTFSSTIENDQNSIIIMEQTAKDFGFEDPQDALQGKIYTKKENLKVNDETPWKTVNPTIIGIVEDFNLYSLKKQLQPMIFQKVNSIKKHNTYNFYSIRLKIPEGGYDQLSEMIAMVEDHYHEVFEDSAFDYLFLDDFFNKQYQSDQKFGAIIGHFSILAILIACLGMFGLSLFTLQQRTKEIGIRKVHGASISGILILLSK
ncbi:MAG: ABC transporter permease, partial [Cyclobacteriaceae bacterium]|nr:ABC transporter permease [Cyclobacteriaceae bacterium]